MWRSFLHLHRHVLTQPGVWSENSQFLHPHYQEIDLQLGGRMDTLTIEAYFFPEMRKSSTILTRFPSILLHALAATGSKSRPSSAHVGLSGGLKEPRWPLSQWQAFCLTGCDSEPLAFSVWGRWKGFVRAGRRPAGSGGRLSRWPRRKPDFHGLASPSFGGGPDSVADCTKQERCVKGGKKEVIFDCYWKRLNKGFWNVLMGKQTVSLKCRSARTKAKTLNNLALVTVAALLSLSVRKVKMKENTDIELAPFINLHLR